jgi:hypothetical protein
MRIRSIEHEPKRNETRRTSGAQRICPALSACSSAMDYTIIRPFALHECAPQSQPTRVSAAAETDAAEARSPFQASQRRPLRLAAAAWTVLYGRCYIYCCAARLHVAVHPDCIVRYSCA